MIRFTCPNCGREYALPPALARLALLCKGCGHALSVPEYVPEPEPPPPLVFADEGTVDLFPTAAAPPPASSRSPVVVEPPRARGFGIVVDVLVGLALAGVGVLVGEFAAGKGTVDILKDAGGAPKFPTTVLLLWLGCAATPVLAYVLFANRGKSVGAWLRRRG